MSRYFGFKPLFPPLVALWSLATLLVDNQDKSASAKALYTLLFAAVAHTQKWAMIPTGMLLGYFLIVIFNHAPMAGWHSLKSFDPARAAASAHRRRISGKAFV